VISNQNNFKLPIEKMIDPLITQLGNYDEKTHQAALNILKPLILKLTPKQFKKALKHVINKIWLSHCCIDKTFFENLAILLTRFPSEQITDILTSIINKLDKPVIASYVIRRIALLSFTNLVPEIPPKEIGKLVKPYQNQIGWYIYREAQVTLNLLAPKFNPEQMTSIINLIMEKLYDNNINVRRGALSALTELATELNSEQIVRLLNPIVDKLKDKALVRIEALKTVTELTHLLTPVQTDRILECVFEGINYVDATVNDVPAKALGTLTALTPKLTPKRTMDTIKFVFEAINNFTFCHYNTFITTLKALASKLTPDEIANLLEILMRQLKHESGFVTQIALNLLAWLSPKLTINILSEGDRHIRKLALKALAALAPALTPEQTTSILIPVIGKLRDVEFVVSQQFPLKIFEGPQQYR
jgi:hypothetical protein